MDNTLVLYTNSHSRGRIARWMLEEAGVPYRVESIDYGAPMKSEAYLAINPMGKVPALVHDGVVVTECAAICLYVADTFCAESLSRPLGDRLRAPLLRWMFFAAGPLVAAVTSRALGVEVPVDKRGFVGWGGDFGRVLDVLESAVAGRQYLVGDRFSAADVFVGSNIGWGMQFGTIERRAEFERYWDGIRDRPAALRARELDDALIDRPA